MILCYFLFFLKSVYWQPTITACFVDLLFLAAPFRSCLFARFLFLLIKAEKVNVFCALSLLVCQTCADVDDADITNWWNIEVVSYILHVVTRNCCCQAFFGLSRSLSMFLSDSLSLSVYMYALWLLVFQLKRICTFHQISDVSVKGK